MFRTLIRQTMGLLIGAAMIFAAVGPARGAQVSLPAIPLQILGADSLCTSWTLGGTVGAPTLTCVTGTGPVAPSCASLTATPQSITASSGPTTLTANCSGATSYSWTSSTPPSSGFSASTPGNQQQPTIAANTTFTVQAFNGTLGSNTVSVPVTVGSGGGGGGGGGGGAISCPGFSNTVVVDLDVNNPQLSVKQALNQGDAVVVRIKTAASGVYGKVSAAEYSGIAATRFANLSATACDFSTTSGTSIGTTVEVIFSDGPDIYGFYPSMPANSTAYLNLRTTGACGNNCGMLFQMNRY